MNAFSVQRFRKTKLFYGRMQDQRFNILLVSLVVLYLSMPVVQSLFPGADHPLGRIFVTVFFVAMLLSSVLAISKSAAVARIALCLALPAVAFDLAALADDSTVTEVFFHSLNILFLGFTSLVILGHVFSVQKVTLNTISASLCVYFLLGLLWAVVFSLLTVLDPASFNFGFEGNLPQAKAMRFGSGDSIYPIYFSLVTMTTLGYGDITPATSTARTFSAFEAVMGQLYLAVLVARLVGLHTSQSFRRRFGGGEEKEKD